MQRRTADLPIQAGLRLVSTGYFEAAGISMVSGRDFTVDDRADGAPVAILNQTMARRWWPGSDPLGRRLRLAEDDRWFVIVGVVSDIKHMGLTRDEGPVLYVPYVQKTQDWLSWSSLLVRTAAEPRDLVASVRGAIHAVDKDQPVIFI